MNEGDMKNVDFVVVDSGPSVLTGTVDGPKAAMWQKHITVELLKKEGSSTTFVRSTPLPISRFFEFTDVPRDHYVVRLSFGLPETTHDFQAETAEADMRDRRTLHVGEIKFTAKSKQGDEVRSPTHADDVWPVETAG